MKKLLFLVTLLCHYFVFTQNEGIEVIYKTVSKYDISKLELSSSLNANQLEYTKKLKSQMEEISYILRATVDQSIFETVYQMQTGDKSSPLAEYEKNQKFYIDKEKSIEGKNFQGEQLLIIEKPYNQNWKIVDEETEILGFKCKKAELTYKEANQEFNIIAWFAPAINYNYGPKGFHGLPGLILKIERNNVLIYEAIELKEKKNLLITVPYRGKKITREEFDQRMLDIINMMKQ